MEFITKQRDKLFPEFKGKWHTRDFLDVTVKKLAKSNVKEMNYKYWFYFHPSAYKLMYWGGPLVTICFVSPLMIYTLLNGRYWSGTISTILILALCYGLWKKWRTRHLMPKEMTFYHTLLARAEDEAGIIVN